MSPANPIQILVDILGWAGAVLYLLAYSLFSTKKLPGDSYAYQLMNLFGGLLLLVNAVYFRAYPSVGVNAVWALITVYALVQKRQAGKVRV